MSLSFRLEMKTFTRPGASLKNLLRPESNLCRTMGWHSSRASIIMAVARFANCMMSSTLSSRPQRSLHESFLFSFGIYVRHDFAKSPIVQ